MARLLVSVRSPEEARFAVEGGADIIDVKEPSRGPLGRADTNVWKAIRGTVPLTIPVSVALGELHEWMGETIPPDLSNLSYWKLGLANCDEGWARNWRGIQREWRTGPGWIAVAYADWERARSPGPELVLAEAIDSGECVGILVDTWDKASPSPIDLTWKPWFDRARDSGLTTALAGRLDLATIARLAPLRPNIIAVRGAACVEGDRRGDIDTGRVAGLASAAHAI